MDLTKWVRISHTLVKLRLLLSLFPRVMSRHQETLFQDFESPRMIPQNVDICFLRVEEPPSK